MQIIGIVLALIAISLLVWFFIYIVRIYTNITVERTGGMKKLYRKPYDAAGICHNEFCRMARLGRTLQFTDTGEDCIAFEVLKDDGTVEITFTFTGQPELIKPLWHIILADLARDKFKDLRS